MLRGEVIPSLALHALGLGRQEEEPSRRLKDYIPLECCCPLVPTTKTQISLAFAPRTCTCTVRVLYKCPRSCILRTAEGSQRSRCPFRTACTCQCLVHLAQPGTAISHSRNA
jgi:hypothetical protein